MWPWSAALSHLAEADWWRQPGLNRRPRACKARALPTELCPRSFSALVQRLRRAASLISIERPMSKHRDKNDVTNPTLESDSTSARPIELIDHLRPALGTIRILLRKEVIQPQVPLRLPCYDFIPITTHTLGTFLPCGLDQRLLVQTALMM